MTTPPRATGTPTNKGASDKVNLLVVETKAIQDDVGLYGDPAIILGEGGALDFILAEFQKVDLKPNLKKFQAYTTSPAEFQAAFSAEQERWLKRTFIITDPILRSQVKHAETLASEAKASAANAPGDQGGSRGSGAAPGRVG